MKKLILVALLGVMTMNAKAQDQVTISDVSYIGKGGPKCPMPCPGDGSLTFTLVNPSDCDHPVTITVYAPAPFYNFNGVTYTSSSLGYAGYVIVSVIVPTVVTPLIVGDYITPLVCSLTPFADNEATCCDVCCQYGARWVYPSTSYTGVAYLYLT